jgi:hypothetical protein
LVVSESFRTQSLVFGHSGKIASCFKTNVSKGYVEVVPVGYMNSSYLNEPDVKNLNKTDVVVAITNHME